jgi:hypothetical protein
VEQLSELCFRGRGRGANRSVGRGQNENPDASSMSPHLYKERKGGPAPLNLNIYGSTAGVSTGSYPVNWWTYVIGYGPTLHVVSGPGGNGGLDSQQTLQFGPNQATLHIASGYVYNPLGAFFHWLLNMTKAGGYPQC